MTEKDKNYYRDKLFESNLKQSYYIAEHKEESPVLREKHKALRREYAKVLLKEKRSNQNDKH